MLLQIEANEGSCSLVTGNVGNPADVQHMFETISKSCDALDVLVNNAGVAHIGLLIDMTDEEWAQVIVYPCTLRVSKNINGIYDIAQFIV